MNHLGDNFYVMPRYANTTMTQKELKETLLDTGGEILTCGRMWDIVSKNLGAGIYKVSLKEDY